MPLLRGQLLKDMGEVGRMGVPHQLQVRHIGLAAGQLLGRV